LAAISRSLTRTSFRTRVFGSGRPTGNCNVPFEDGVHQAGMPLTSLTTLPLCGKYEQCCLHPSKPATATPSTLKQACCG
jgi:hypothetical protein